jgi:hypothetical protein
MTFLTGVGASALIFGWSILMIGWGFNIGLKEGKSKK